MKKKALLILIICLISLCLTGCKHKNDHIELYNKDSHVFDNINIEIKEGYFYDRHEKFTVDEHTVGVTIYFSNDEDTWD
jgi:hypothetical protein